MRRALELGGERTKKAAVTRALEEFIARRVDTRVWSLAFLARAASHCALRLWSQGR